MTLTTLTRDQLLAKSGVLLVVDQIQPPSGPVAKGGVPVLKPKEQGLFIAVNDDGQVYGFNGHVDLGTGIRTSLAQIVAEELDLVLDQVCMVLGDTDNAPNQGATIASATLQITAVPLRNAAAEARRFLLARAARLWGVEAQSLQIEKGVVNSSDGRQLSFAELVAGEQHVVSISGDAPLKAVQDYRLVGQSSARVDIPAKATGELTYVHDMRLPDMLHGRVIRPPYAGLDSGDFVGKSLLHVDESSIAHIPGVVKVVVIGDFVGVVALREEQAVKAAQALIVTWKAWNQKLPDMTDVEQAIRDNPRIQRVVLDKGNVQQALAQPLSECLALTCGLIRFMVPSARPAGWRTISPRTSAYGRARKTRTCYALIWPGCWSTRKNRSKLFAWKRRAVMGATVPMTCVPMRCCCPAPWVCPCGCN